MIDSNSPVFPKGENSMEKKTLKKTGRVIVNTHCGLVTGLGKRVIGCGAKPGDYLEYSYKLKGYELFSTVVLCPKCGK